MHSPVSLAPKTAIHAPRTIAIVGNAPETRDHAAAIDAAEWVVRFNNTSGLDGHTGRRVTHLALVNHGGQMREWLADPLFATRPGVSRADTILFPFAQKLTTPAANDEDGRDWTVEATERLAATGCRIEILPAEVHRAAADILRPAPGGRRAPSTGFLVALHLLFRFGGQSLIDVYGFGFDGWDAHDWRGERRWFQRMAAEGMLALHTPGERAAA